MAVHKGFHENSRPTLGAVSGPLSPCVAQAIKRVLLQHEPHDVVHVSMRNQTVLEILLARHFTAVTAELEKCCGFTLHVNMTELAS